MSLRSPSLSPLPADNPLSYLHAFRKTWRELCSLMPNHQSIVLPHWSRQESKVDPAIDTLLHPLSRHDVIQDEALLVGDARKQLYESFRCDFQGSTQLYRRRLATLLARRGHNLPFSRVQHIKRDFDHQIQAICETFENHIKDIVCYADNKTHPRASDVLSGIEISNAYNHYRSALSVIQHILYTITQHQELEHTTKNKNT
ncbi:MAG: hypothetical protein GDA50_03325 [Alphaproteobacteria bacterium GM202ARS2]|nr:hypothetical protein [Alphaproteobacteria bacterium GM202ARS2]